MLENATNNIYPFAPDKRPGVTDWRFASRLLSIALLVGLIYGGALNGPFVFDDVINIERNPGVRSLWPPAAGLRARRPVPVAGRPLVEYSFALNYAWSGLQPWSYRLVNILIHLAAAGTLMALVERLLRTAAGGRLAAAAPSLAWAAALLWAVHPLQTEAVAYVSQRSEALFGLAGLLALWAVARGHDSARPAVWRALAAAFALAAMLGKEVAVVLPLLILMFEWLYWPRRERPFEWKLYAALAVWTLGLVGLVFAAGTPGQLPHQGFTPLEYARTQPLVILHYLGLSVWPGNLCLDYAWPPATWGEALPAALVLGALLALTGAALMKRHPLAGPLAAFFLILAPTSSVLPLGDIAFEHRCYLPLAALAVLAVLGAREVLVRLWPELPRRRMAVGMALTVAAVAALTARAQARARDYADEERLLAATVAAAPANARAWYNLGTCRLNRDNPSGAAEALEAARRLDPADAATLYNLGVALDRTDRPQLAIEMFRQAAARNPTDARAWGQLGGLLAAGDLQESLACLRRAVALDPAYLEARCNLALLLSRAGHQAEAAEQFAACLKLHPDDAQLHYLIGRELLRTGDRAAARQHFVRAAELGHPEAPEALRQAEKH